MTLLAKKSTVVRVCLFTVLLISCILFSTAIAESEAPAETSLETPALTQSELKIELFKTVRKGRRLSLIKKLVSDGVDVNATDLYGRTALMLVVNNHRDPHQIAIIKLLIEAGTDFDARDKSGETALIKVKITNKENVIKILEDAGAKYPEEDQKYVADKKQKIAAANELRKAEGEAAAMAKKIKAEVKKQEAAKRAELEEIARKKNEEIAAERDKDAPQGESSSPAVEESAEQENTTKDAVELEQAK